jgi:hypothetical protein
MLSLSIKNQVNAHTITRIHILQPCSGVYEHIFVEYRLDHFVSLFLQLHVIRLTKLLTFNLQCGRHLRFSFNMGIFLSFFCSCIFFLWGLFVYLNALKYSLIVLTVCLLTVVMRFRFLYFESHPIPSNNGFPHFYETWWSNCVPHRRKEKSPNTQIAETPIQKYKNIPLTLGDLSFRRRGFIPMEQSRLFLLRQAHFFSETFSHTKTLSERILCVICCNTMS